jgi:hypothetical protein
LPDFFGLCPTTPEKIFEEQINFGDLPPRRQKNFGQCTILGVQKFFRNYNKPILPNCEANIARLHLFDQQTGGFLAFSLFNFPLFARLMLNICPTFRLCNLLGGGQLPPPAPPPSRTPMVPTVDYHRCSSWQGILVLDRNLRALSLLCEGRSTERCRLSDIGVQILVGSANVSNLRLRKSGRSIFYLFLECWVCLAESSSLRQNKTPVKMRNKESLFDNM